MASYTTVTTKHATLTGHDRRYADIRCTASERDHHQEHATEILSVTFGQRGGAAATPIARGDGTYIVRAGEARQYSLGGITSVKVLGNGNIIDVEGA